MNFSISPFSLRFSKRFATGSRPRFSRLTASAIVGPAVVGLFSVSCAAQEPQLAPPTSQLAPVTVGFVAGDEEQAVMAQVYAHAFSRVHRQAGVMELPDATARIDAVRNHATTVGFGCTGELLGILDPQRAQELAAEFKVDTSPGKEQSPQWRDRVYAAFSESLPGTVMATDPSNVQGCEDTDKANPGAALPQHIVPFYSKPALTRRERVEVLNRVAGSLSSKDYEEMLAQKADGQAAEEIASEWVKTSRFATG